MREISQKIIAIPTTDLEMMRLKARIYLWSEAKEFETFAAEIKDGDWSDEALVSLFRDLGVDHLFRDPDADDQAETSADEETMSTAEIAALQFEPLSAKTLKDLEPPSNDKWLEHLVMIRLALVVLGKTKDELKDILEKADADGEVDLIDNFARSVDFLKACEEVMGASEIRLLSAGAAFALEAQAAQVARA